MSDYSVSITVARPAAEVLRAINNVHGWWFGTIEGITDQLGGEFTYEVKDIHWSKQRITELTPTKVAWSVVDSDLTFTSARREWTGTTIELALRSRGAKTSIAFAHRGLVPAFECYGNCSSAWDVLIRKNLRGWIETGKAQPSPW